ncbi:hypothetical protein PHYBLDRAFT_165111 [Phycomyces blakesleeanus NRRL 1555(-)]|uniref:Uncharacterized protein n=1 Tax=Phycomyces blakesleeanus (strain ATCC 8743b / DSM 1359 / FGSC 10004 / NBRC 33097 / NRRL 1555) TaxID=763407 RepID=A0A162UNG3_PHYB8|nr:hypothetical protein PHYBLDRAFT_165111 [Phycomyces blakesleeanus NRRL 1555(-)]OAD76583.1 hypothetical protein PHYBLDRAFT_165111 [Phycomyces blakesleeanus NRRL 1555(-)]|eukprot:XP_018294623.1 hypothetical protein PHYBLDRAFT_165111 [Phycomyces blakesleeanus NRRL 1555(-)]
MRSTHGHHCISCDYIGNLSLTVSLSSQMCAPNVVNRGGGNRNLKRGGNGTRKPSTSEQPTNVKNRPGLRRLLQHQPPYWKLARAKKDKMLERVYHGKIDRTARMAKVGEKAIADISYVMIPLRFQRGIENGEREAQMACTGRVRAVGGENRNEEGRFGRKRKYQPALGFQESQIILASWLTVKFSHWATRTEGKVCSPDEVLT